MVQMKSQSVWPIPTGTTENPIVVKIKFLRKWCFTYRPVSMLLQKCVYANKRGSVAMDLDLKELNEFVRREQDGERTVVHTQTEWKLCEFVDQLSDIERCVFLRRYWYLDSTQEICMRYGYSERKVKQILKRIRKQLLTLQEKENVL